MKPIHEEILGHTIISSKNITTYKDKKDFQKTWVAKITGIDKKFGFSREFVNKEESDFMPDVDIVFFYLKAGCLYQYNNLYVDKGVYTSGYFAVMENGNEILSLEKDQVRKLLGMPVKEWKIKKESYVSDEIDF